MGEQKKRIDLVGQRFGRLVVISYAFTDNNKAYWNCVCDCGNECIKPTYALKYNNVKSCGCLHREVTSQRNKDVSKWHGASKNENQRLYRIWSAMRHRCYSENDKHYNVYGGRGISVCSEWENDYFVFEKWSLENGYTDELTIDRIDTNGNYEPSNCRWISQKEQCNNKRNNKYLTYKGETHTLREWCEILGLPYDRTKQRINACHMTVEQAFELPKQQLKRKVNSN